MSSKLTLHLLYHDNPLTQAPNSHSSQMISTNPILKPESLHYYTHVGCVFTVALSKISKAGSINLCCFGLGLGRGVENRNREVMGLTQGHTPMPGSPQHIWAVGWLQRSPWAMHQMGRWLLGSVSYNPRTRASGSCGLSATNFGEGQVFLTLNSSLSCLEGESLPA